VALTDELGEIMNKASDSDDVEELARFQQRCETIVTNIAKSIAAEQDSGLREHLQEVQAQATETLVYVKERLAEVKVERMDPDYDRRREEKRLAEERRQQEEMEKAKQFLGGGGLGDLLGGLMGAIGGAGAKQAGAGSTAPAVTAGSGAGKACSSCGSELKAGAKFCPECGTPVAQERACSSCGGKLQPGAKFCPECGTKA